MTNETKVNLLALVGFVSAAVFVGATVISFNLPEPTPSPTSTSAKYQSGDCVKQDYSNEFEQRYSYFIVERVGKTQYLIRRFHESGILFYDTDTYRFSTAESDSEKIECPLLAEPPRGY